MNIFTFIDQNAKFKKDKQAIVYIVFHHTVYYTVSLTTAVSLELPHVKFVTCRQLVSPTSP